jgi:hypothetical protein
MANDIPVKDISELLDAVSGKIPKMIGGIMDTMYSAEAGQRMGQAVGSFYKELVNSGIPPQEAIKMARDYMLSIKEIAKNVKSTDGDVRID